VGPHCHSDSCFNLGILKRNETPQPFTRNYLYSTCMFNCSFYKGNKIFRSYNFSETQLTNESLRRVLTKSSDCQSNLNILIRLEEPYTYYQHHSGTNFNSSDSSSCFNHLTPWASECQDVKNYKWRLNPVWHRMLYSCIHLAAVGVKGLTANVGTKSTTPSMREFSLKIETTVSNVNSNLVPPNEILSVKSQKSYSKTPEHTE